MRGSVVEHVDVARAGAVAGLGERDRELALDRLGVHREHVSGADQEPVAHDRIGVAGERAVVHAAHRTWPVSCEEWTSTSRTSTACSATRCGDSPRAWSLPSPRSWTRTAASRSPSCARRRRSACSACPCPEADGGAGGDTLAYALCIEELARVDSSFAITVAAHTSLGTMPILLFGDERAARASGCRSWPRASASRPSA